MVPMDGKGSIFDIPEPKWKHDSTVRKANAIAASQHNDAPIDSHVQQSKLRYTVRLLSSSSKIYRSRSDSASNVVFGGLPSTTAEFAEKSTATRAATTDSPFSAWDWWIPSGIEALARSGRCRWRFGL